MVELSLELICEVQYSQGEAALVERENACDERNYNICKSNFAWARFLCKYLLLQTFFIYGRCWLSLVDFNLIIIDFCERMGHTVMFLFGCFQQRRAAQCIHLAYNTFVTFSTSTKCLFPPNNCELK